MKWSTALAVGLVVITTLQVPAQESIEGIWLTEEKDTKVEIYQNNGVYYGKIVWLNQATDSNGSPITDRNNPNKALRSRQLMGTNILEDLQYRGGTWYGKIYAPKRGLKTDAVLVPEGTDTLKLTITYRGFTRQQIWIRSNL